MLNGRRFICSLALVAATLGISASARADYTGYVCQSAWVPNPGAFGGGLANMGAFGAVYAWVYTGAKCTGTKVGMAYYCTTGATNTTSCALNQLMTERQAANLATTLQQAGAAGQKVMLYTTTPTSSAGVMVEFTQP
jgi:hypothetical protein